MKIKGRMKVSYPFFVTLSQKKKNSYVTITILSVGYAYEDLEGMWIWKRKQENESKKTKEGICGSRELCGMWMLCKSLSARGDCCLEGDYGESRCG